MIDLDIHGNTKPLEASVQAAINRIRRQPIKITVDDKGATQPLGNMKRGADEFSKSMEAANARIIAFGASMAIINGVSDAFKGMVKNMVEVEKALADINVVMGLSAKNLDKFSDSLFKVAKETGAAFNIAAQAATEYARQGLAVEESLKRTKDALILTRLTGMDSAEAVKSLTAAMNTYGNQIKDTTQLVSKFAAVDVQFAVSAEDFADAIARTGAAAKGAGVDINELIGFVTAAQQQTARGGKVIGNSLKTIFTRVGRTDTLNQLEGLGIAVRDLEGKTLGAKRILTDLANTFDRLSESQKAQIAQTVGGVFQINVLKAVLGDAAKQNGILSTATQIAAGATNEAIEKNEQLRQTMSAMATETGLAIKQLSAQIGEIMLAPGMEKILNTVKSFAESASGILGDGESTGNKFATGFLRGLGNIITGPGLVVLTTVFVKLFAQAFKFTKDSLNSLVGITTQAQKQKAIQTSLVTLFGQNAALNKEMLRTDISRAEKERIILGLIQAQVAQAKTLNEVSRQAASTLYKQGYGPSLSPRKGRAKGHIPNFSERQQAAEGGYAAGNIRTMDMPGQGPIIYNSAEKVKNFAGLKQPAIMPPRSSKAGKNYQQAFAKIHGFDPYAADGFVPNFSKKDSSNTPLFMPGRSKTSNPVLNLKSFLGPVVGTLGVIHGVGPEGEIDETYTQPITGKKGISGEAQGALVKAIQAKGHKNFTSADLKGKSIQVTLPTKAISPVTDQDLEDIKRGLGATVAQNHLGNYIKDGLQDFAEKIHERIFAGSKTGEKPNFTADKIMSHVGSGAVGDMYEASLRTALGDKIEENKHASFDFRGKDAEYLAAFMGDPGLRALEMKYTRAAGKDGEIPKKVINYALLGKASGYIPNFAANSWESEPRWKWSMNSDYIAFQKKKNEEELNKRISKFGNDNISLTGKYSGNLPVARITDPGTGTYTDFTYGKGHGETSNSTSIIYSSRGEQDKKGGAFRNFGVLSDFTNKQGGKDKSIYSDFDQINTAVGKSPWAMVLRAFPQLKQRIKPGMVTSGEMNIGYDTLTFNSLRSLKMQISKWVKKNGLKAFQGYSEANLGYNEKNSILSGTSSGDLFSIGGLRTRMLTRKDKNYLNDSKVGFAASGYIPGFEDPLADAISRERQAGVPVSQIRVDSHPALVNKSNPIGLGVTNTKDEPNGLRDVFGAKGFVPNYAFGSVKDAISGFTLGFKSEESERDNILELNRNRDLYSQEIIESKKEEERLQDQLKSQRRALERRKAEGKNVERATRRAADTENQLSEAKKRRMAAEQNAAKAANVSRSQAYGAGIANKMGGMSTMAVMGAPMAASFLQPDGPGQTGSGATMYAAGGALQGAASTGYMASMIAPFLGPAAPFVVAAGALYGAFDGYTSAMAENTAALKQREAEISQSNTQKLSQDLGSQLSKIIFQDASLSEGMRNSKKILEASQNLKNAPDFQNLSDIITTGSVIGKSIDLTTELINKVVANPFSQYAGFRYSEKYATNYADSLRGLEYNDELERAQQSNKDREKIIKTNLPIVRNTIMDAMKSLGDKEVYVSRIEKDKEGRSVLSNEKYNVSADQYLKALEESGILDNAELISQLGADVVAIYEQHKNAAKEQVKGILVEIDKQKAQRILKAQIFDSEMKIKRDAVIREGLYSAEIELHKGFLSERRQTQIKYNKAIEAAADALKSGTEKAMAEFRTNIVNFAERDPKFRAQLATNLPGVKNKLTETATKSEITEAIVSVDFEELKGLAIAYKNELEKIQEGETEIDGAKKAQIESMVSMLDKFKESKDELDEINALTKTGLDLQNTTNQILDERKRIIQENTDALRMFNEESARNERMRKYDIDIQEAALRSSGAHITKEQQALIGIARAEGDVSSHYASMAKQKHGELNKLGLSDTLKQSILSGNMSLEEAVKQQKELNFYNTADGGKLKGYEMQVASGGTSSITQSVSGSDLPSIDAPAQGSFTEWNPSMSGSSSDTRTTLEPLQTFAKKDEEYDNIRKQKELALEITEEEQKKLQEIERTLIGITLEEEKGVEAIRAKAKARLTELQNMKNDGFKYGFKKGFGKMQEQVEYMDYHLAEKIPENLANGLASAMGEALNGTKKLDEALQDVALNFLQMIQQAFLQKMAYSIVGGIGSKFNNGGSVKQYSKGGTVPAYVSNGEYLMSKGAVNKYGGAFMHNLNNGGVPKYHGGGSVADFFKNSSELTTKRSSLADFFSSPLGGRSSVNNSAAIRNSIAGNMSDLLGRKNFQSSIKSGALGLAGMAPSSDVLKALSPASQVGKRGFFGSIATGISDLGSAAFSMISAPFKALGSMFGFKGFNEGGEVKKTNIDGKIIEEGSALASNFGGGRGIDSGRLYQRQKMSGFFYSQSGNVGVAEDKENMIGILREEERQRQEAEARRRRKKAKRKQLLGTILSTVVTAGLSSVASGGGLGGLFGGGGGTAPLDIARGGSDLLSLAEANQFNASMATSLNPFNNLASSYTYDSLTGNSFLSASGNNTGGMIRKYSFGGGPLRDSLKPSLVEQIDEDNPQTEKKNLGGWISGKSGIDQIPAMLSDGEYVIKASSARKLGRPMLDQINAGKFNEGGSVGDDSALSSKDSESISGNTNNISITVNVEKGQAVESSRDESKGNTNPKESDDQEKNSAELAERVKHQVVAVILEEQRPGGLLSKTVQ